MPIESSVTASRIWSVNLESSIMILETSFYNCNEFIVQATGVFVPGNVDWQLWVRLLDCTLKIGTNTLAYLCGVSETKKIVLQSIQNW
jgi:hypothetical protein